MTHLATMFSGDKQPMKTEQFFRCLADPLRLRIVLLLWQQGELSTQVIAERLHSSENHIRRQMVLLSKNQLVRFRQKELFHCYQLNTDLPVWVQKTLKHTWRGNKALLDEIPAAQKTHPEQPASSGNQQSL